MPKKYERECDGCGKPYKGEGKKFCSHECDVASRQPADEPPPGAPQEFEAPSSYQLIDGKFLFVIAGKLVAIEYERWDTICREYSDFGGRLSTAEVARKHGIPRQILARILAAYGQFKASPPNCRERIGEHKADFAPLVTEAIENDEHRFLGELERSRDTAWREDYLRLKREEVTQDRIISAAETFAGKWKVRR